ncbi:MAG TPA: TIGR03435 family protein [Bryobacteraceae bacterium]|nr:TIGR03435 family protein [Bryobacteraceae bacterium]
MILNHLWQSTLCVAVAWLLTLALTKNRAAVRYWIWLAASAKFLIPFSLLVSAGNMFPWRAAPSIAPSQFSFVVDQVTQPFAAPASSSPLPIPATAPNFLPILLAIWLFGIAIGVFVWMRSWLRVRAALRTASPLHLRLPIPVMSSATRLEPGVFGIFKPVLLLPDGIAEHMSPAQLEAILAHELCHVRRLDNLTAAVHMAVETVFWFHPLVWWIGKRLADERERACDEEVLQLGSEPQVYAESILKVCKFYLQSPLDCVSGITGSDLRKRIRGIMTNRVSRELGAGRKLLLAAAGLAAVVAPVVVGLLNAPASRAQSQPATGPEFEVASVKPHKPQPGPLRVSTSVENGRLNFTNVTLKNCIQRAFSLRPYQISGGPGWLADDRFDVIAKAAGPADKAQVMRMLQTLLADRFKLKFHIETKEMPVYSLVVAKNGLKIKEANDDGKGTQIDGDPQHPLSARNISMAGFAGTLSRLQELDRPVIDATGLKGVFNFTLDYSPGDAAPSDNAGPSIFTALTEQLGLKLEAGKGPVDILVIDHVERPSDNDQAFFKKAMWSPQTFEVASIRPSDPNAADGFKSVNQKPTSRDFQVEHRRFSATNSNLFALIVKAYGVMGCRPLGGGECALISGGPDWLKKDGFDIVAKMPDDSPDYNLIQFQNGHTPQLQLMLQALLADRFALKVHHETKNLPVYALTVGKKGPKLKRADGSKEPRLMFHGSAAPDGLRMIQLVVENGSMQELVDLYSRFMDRPMIDKTGLKDRYDFTADYEANTEALGPFADLSGPALFKALEEQAGLKLEVTKGPVEILVIDHAEKPSAN